MKKVLGLSLVACSIFSMQLELTNFANKVSNFQKKILHHDVFKFNDSHNVQSKSDKGLIKPTSVFVPHQLGSMELYHDKKGFHVLQDDKKYEIKKKGHEVG